MRSQPMMPNVLVIDSHTADRDAAERFLRRDGFGVTLAADASAGVAAARALRPDAVLLDTALPGGEGTRLLEELRRDALARHVLVVTASGALDEKLRAFALGADDYVMKPCHWLEVVARLRAVCRRGTQEDTTDSVVCFGDVTLHPLARTVRRGGFEVRLRPKEYDLLVALVDRRGEVVTRDRLLAEVWGYAPGTTTRTVDSHVFTLRRKLEPDPERPRYIVTVNRYGYRLDAEGTGWRQVMRAS
jgi:two-component system, OmpR family, alkaline phosphatase synthesis response regulator PhoP